MNGTEPPSLAASPRWRPIPIVLACGLVGPLAGLLIAGVAAGLYTAVTEGLSSGFYTLLGALNPVVWPFAYLFGGVQSVLGGVVYLAVDKYAPAEASRLLLAAVIGAAMTALIWIVFAGFGGTVSSLATMAGIGAASAVVCAYLTRNWRYRPDDLA